MGISCLVGCTIEKPLSLRTLIGLPLVDTGPTYTCARVASAIASDAVPVSLYSSHDRRSKQHNNIAVNAVIKGRFAKLPHRLTRWPAAQIAERRFERDCLHDPHSVAYLWGENSLALAHSLKRNSIRTVREKFNCAKAVAGQILAEAYAQLGEGAAFDQAPFAQHNLEREYEQMQLADYIFCPSPGVRESLISIGVDGDKLLLSSYGWEPDRILGESIALPPHDGPTFLFVGYACVRKGVHILLDAWHKTNVNGRLVILGAIEPAIQRRFGHILSRPDVILPGFQRDVGAFFRSADAFIMPSLEEGSPLVTYEAAGSSLPCLVSPMAAGPLIRHGVEGAVIDPADSDRWAESIACFDPGQDSVKEQAHRARARAAEFTWDKVGEQRREQLLQKFGAH